ncbi:MAG TPA: DciA family protein [Burkholderiales bacterium]|nr:DciA family protein [Burkholderiales bacterium]
MQPSKVGRLLASDAGLQPVIAKAREINALSKLCFDFLPPELARLVRAVNLRDHQLVLVAASPAAAAKLKLLAEALRNYLLEQRAQVNSVSVRVQPGGTTVYDAPARQPARLSQSALDALQALHQRLPDSPARKALKTLLDHHLRR